MPTVPRYGGRQIERAPLPTVRTPTDVPSPAPTLGEAVATGIGQAAGTAADVMAQRYLREKERADQMVVTEANAQRAALRNRILYDPEKGVLNIKGKEALRGREIADEEWTKGVAEIEATLTSDRQKEAFRRATLEDAVSLESSIMQHASRELERYDVESTQSLWDNELNAAVSAAAVEGAPLNDVMDKATSAIARQRASVVDFADRNNLSDERKQFLLESRTSATHTAVIEQLMANDQDLSAKSYYNEFKDQLKGKDATQMAKLIQEGSVRGESQRIVDDLLIKHRDDREAMVAAVRKIKDPEVRDASEQRLHSEFNRLDAIERDTREKEFIEAANILDPYIKRGRPFLASEVIPKPLWNKLRVDARAALQRYAGDRENDVEKWHEFLELTPGEMGNLNAEEFRKNYWSWLDNANRTRAESLWQAARDAKRTGRLEPKTAADLTFKDQVNITLRSLRLVPHDESTGKWSKSQYKLWADVMLESTKIKEQQEAEKQRPLNSTEIQEVIDGVVKRVWFDDGGWFGAASRRLLERPVSRDDQGRAVVLYDDIPPDQAIKADSILRAAGKTSTRDKVQRLFAAAVLGDVKSWEDILKEK